MFPWHHRWTVLALALLLQAVFSGVFSFSFSYWVVPWLDEFNVPRSNLMLIIGAASLAVGFMAPFCGAMLDRFPPHWPICFGAFVFAAGMVAISVTGSHWEVLFLYSTLLALGEAMCGVLGWQKIITIWFVSNRGTALGIGALGLVLGGLIVPPASAAMLATLGWRETFRFWAVVTLLFIPLAWAILRKKPESDESEAASAAGPVAGGTGLTTRQLLSDRNFWIVVFCFGTMMMSLTSVLNSTAVYALDLGISQQRAALITSVGAIAMGFGKFAFGRFADRVAIRRLYWLASGGMVLSVIGVSFSQTLALLMATNVVFYFCFGAYVLMSVCIVQIFGSMTFARVLGLALAIIQIATLSPYITALLQEATGSYRLAFIVMTSPLLLGMLVMRRLPQRTVAS